MACEICNRRRSIRSVCGSSVRDIACGASVSRFAYIMVLVCVIHIWDNLAMQMVRRDMIFLNIVLICQIIYLYPCNKKGNFVNNERRAIIVRQTWSGGY